MLCEYSYLSEEGDGEEDPAMGGAPADPAQGGGAPADPAMGGAPDAGMDPSMGGAPC